jgi:putative MFS transporter
MSKFSSTLSDRQAIWAFVLGCIAVTVGVVLHLPMFLMASEMGYQMAGMPMDDGMIFGMVLIVAGVCVSAYGLLPRNLAAQREAGAGIDIAAPEDASLSFAHWRLMLVLVVALIIDVMKPATLGFTVPGMISEYGITKATASLVPFSALTGTVTGSIVWGVVADVYGRKATILLSAVMFVGTSICGAMPSFAWNIGMCFMMGMAAGGMLPVTYALLAEMMPNRHRGWSLVLVGGLGAVGGYFAASGFSAVLQPLFGWRILWLINLPTGLILVFLGVFIPESAKFLIARGRLEEAEAVMRQFGAVMRKALIPLRGKAGVAEVALRARSSEVALTSDVNRPLNKELDHDRQINLKRSWSSSAKLTAKLVAFSMVGIAWGLVNFGLLLWLPADLVAKGYSVGVSSKLLAQSAMIAFPTIFLAALIYSRWSTKWSLAVMIGVTICGLLGVLQLELHGGDSSPVLPVALLIVGSNGIIAILLPYAAESFPLRMRARATGWVAACTKGGGLLAQSLSIMALVPSMEVVAMLIIAPATVSLVLIAWFGRETRGRDLRALDAVPNLLGGEVS